MDDVNQSYFLALDDRFLAYTIIKPYHNNQRERLKRAALGVFFHMATACTTAYFTFAAKNGSKIKQPSVDRGDGDDGDIFGDGEVIKMEKDSPFEQAILNFHALLNSKNDDFGRDGDDEVVLVRSCRAVLGMAWASLGILNEARQSLTVDCNLPSGIKIDGSPVVDGVIGAWLNFWLHRLAKPSVEGATETTNLIDSNTLGNDSWAAWLPVSEHFRRQALLRPSDDGAIGQEAKWTYLSYTVHTYLKHQSRHNSNDSGMARRAWPERPRRILRLLDTRLLGEDRLLKLLEWFSEEPHLLRPLASNNDDGDNGSTRLAEKMLDVLMEANKVTMVSPGRLIAFHANQCYVALKCRAWPLAHYLTHHLLLPLLSSSSNYSNFKDNPDKNELNGNDSPDKGGLNGKSPRIPNSNEDHFFGRLVLRKVLEGHACNASKFGLFQESQRTVQIVHSMFPAAHQIIHIEQDNGSLIGDEDEIKRLVQDARQMAFDGNCRGAIETLQEAMRRSFNIQIPSPSTSSARTTNSSLTTPTSKYGSDDESSFDDALSSEHCLFPSNNKQNHPNLTNDTKKTKKKRTFDEPQAANGGVHRTTSHSSILYSEMDSQSASIGPPSASSYSSEELPRLWPGPPLLLKDLKTTPLRDPALLKLPSTDSWRDFVPPPNSALPSHCIVNRMKWEAGTLGLAVRLWCECGLAYLLQTDALKTSLHISSKNDNNSNLTNLSDWRMDAGEAFGQAAALSQLHHEVYAGYGMLAEISSQLITARKYYEQGAALEPIITSSFSSNNNNFPRDGLDSVWSCRAHLDRLSLQRAQAKVHPSNCSDPVHDNKEHRINVRNGPRDDRVEEEQDQFRSRLRCRQSLNKQQQEETPPAK